MGWFTGLLARRALGAVASPDPSDEPAIDVAPNDARSAHRSMEDPARRPEPQIAEEIRRRQVVLITRYVMMARAR